MTPSAMSSTLAMDRERDLRNGLIPPLIVITAVLFNSALAAVNANVYSINAGPVIAVEVFLILSAHLYIVMNYRPAMTPWYILTMIILVFAFFRMSVTGDTSVKYFRDFWIMPTFILLGMLTNERRLFFAIYTIQFAICMGVIWEATNLNSFASTLEIKRYYMETRGVPEEDFWDKTSNLYISATRPEARYFPFFDLHRLSSLYLEPVSLGNHVSLMTAFMLAFWGRMSKRARVLMVLGTLLCLFACDGRLAATSAIIMIALAVGNRYLPKNISLVLLPLTVLGAFVGVYMLGFTAGDDNFTGRVAHTVKVLNLMDIWNYFGLSNAHMEPAFDSGIAYLIITHSLVIILLFWCMIVFTLEEDTPEQKIYKNCLCLFICLAMLISYSFVGIKTAAPFWFIFGALMGARAPIMSRLIAPKAAAAKGRTSEPTVEEARPA